MAKRLFLILFAGFIGVALNPSFLTADDYLKINQPDFNAVETVLPEPEPVEVKSVAVTNSAPAAATVAQPVATPKPAQPAVPQLVNYTVSYYIGSIDEYVRTAYSLSYNGLYKFRKMIYGHNTANLLGNLPARKVGEIITITEGGVAKKYRIAGAQVYRKTSDGYLEGNSRLMNDIANNAMGHDVAFLTCHGTSYGNGDASHRYVVFADAI